MPWATSAALLRRRLTWAAPAVVFKMHYAELMAKEDEISKLNAVIEALADQ